MRVDRQTLRRKHVAGILINRAKARLPFTRIKKNRRRISPPFSRRFAWGRRFTVRWAESSTLQLANSCRTPVMFEQSPRGLTSGSSMRLRRIRLAFAKIKTASFHSPICPHLLLLVT